MMGTPRLYLALMTAMETAPARVAARHRGTVAESVR